jgi:hypothetical protein
VSNGQGIFQLLPLAAGSLLTIEVVRHISFSEAEPILLNRRGMHCF